MKILDSISRLPQTVFENAANTFLPGRPTESYDNPRIDNGTLLSDDHRVEILEHSVIKEPLKAIGKPEIVKGVGRISRYGFVTELGYPYSVIVGDPSKRETDFDVVAKTAWLTSDRGHNEHTLRRFMQTGNRIVLIGAEGSYHHSANPQGPITLSDSAGAALRASKEVAEADDIEVIGESRGAMVGLGIVALASEYDLNVLLADLTAPCLPRKLTLEEAANLTGQILSEPVELAKLGGRIALKRLLHYPATFDINPKSLAHQLAIGFALFSGEAGELAKNIHPGSLMHIATFSKDFASMEAEWKDIFNNVYYPFTRVTPLRGGHLTLADPETLAFILARNQMLVHSRQNDHPTNPTTIFDAAHELIENPKLVIKEVLQAA